MPNQQKCPHCSSNDLIRSHRSLLERIVIILRPYRCNDCLRRFYKFGLLNPQNRAY